MNLFSRKPDLLTVMALVLMTMSITLMDFKNPGWEGNEKSYVGFVGFLVMMFIKYRNRGKSPSKK